MRRDYVSFFVLVISIVSTVDAIAQCMWNRVKCFDCHSDSDPRCLDPFNWTTLPSMARCDGCCVKMVRGIGTPSYQVERTCTSELQINLFMVDHVCMSESNKKGKLCFCEEDLCNGASTWSSPSLWPFLSILTLIIGDH